MNKLEEFLTDTRVPTCERLDCNENEKGKCALKTIVITSKGQCGWFITKEKNVG